MEYRNKLQQRMERSVSNAIENHKTLANASRWMVAVSGGVDSMVLLHILHCTTEVHGKSIMAAHFNHQLRGDESDKDAEWVRSQCRTKGIDCIEGKGDVRSRAREKGESIEMAARTLRHQFFAKQTELKSTNIIAFAHHADDQLELVLMRLMRGSGPEGLSGMSLYSTSPYDPNLNLWRPLLDFSRNEILEYARSCHIEWREDSSNQGVAHDRNRVRHLLIPKLLQDFGPSVKNGILRSSDLIRSEHVFLNEAANEWEASKTALKNFKNLQKGLQRELMRRALIRVGVVPEFEWIERLRTVSKDTQLTLPSKVMVTVLEQFPLLIICSNEGSLEFDESSVEVTFEDSCGSLTFSDRTVSWELKQGGIEQIFGLNEEKGIELFDAETVGKHILLRHWRAGDRMHPIGTTGCVKLQDWFINEKIEKHRRRRLIVAESLGRGIFWVQGMRISETFKVTSETKKLLVWKCS
jgi:tRNA(Ile)-lysidine synthase